MQTDRDAQPSGMVCVHACASECNRLGRVDDQVERDMEAGTGSMVLRLDVEGINGYLPSMQQHKREPIVDSVQPTGEANGKLNLAMLTG